MALDVTETNSLELTDHGEGGTVNGIAVTCVFVEGKAKRDDDSPTGATSIKDAVMRVLSTVAADYDQRASRDSDSSIWLITDIDESYGMKELTLKRADFIALAKIG